MPPRRELTNSQTERETFLKEGDRFDSKLDVFIRLREQIPDGFVSTLEKGFEKADATILQIIINNLSDLSGIEPTLAKATFSAGKLRIPVSHYDINDNCIYMDDTKSVDDYMRTFRHELGHFIDFTLGVVSESQQFLEAFDNDAKLYNVSTEEGIQRLKYMQLQIAENIHAFASEYITDLISAVTHNDTAFLRTYIENAAQVKKDDIYYYEKTQGVGMSGHSNDYWDFGPYQSKQKEAFANLFAIRVENNPIVQDFLREFFPNLSSEFDKIISKQIKNY